MSNHLQWFAFIPPEPDHQAALEVHQFTRSFYQEIQYRHDFEQYCEQYYALVETHRQEVRKMQGDFNFLGWFYRTGSNAKGRR